MCADLGRLCSLQSETNDIIAVLSGKLNFLCENSGCPLKLQSTSSSNINLIFPALLPHGTISFAYLRMTTISSQLFSGRTNFQVLSY